jgi:hypothetical protein
VGLSKNIASEDGAGSAEHFGDKLSHDALFGQFMRVTSIGSIRLVGVVWRLCEKVMLILANKTISYWPAVLRQPTTGRHKQST